MIFKTEIIVEKVDKKKSHRKHIFVLVLISLTSEMGCISLSKHEIRLHRRSQSELGEKNECLSLPAIFPDILKRKKTKK